MQTKVMIITFILMALMVIVFWRVARGVNADKPLEKVEKKRSALIWTMLVVGIITTIGSLREWPHAIPTGDEVIQVNATGGQWYWEIDTVEIPLNRTVVFNLTTVDVNHGFGVVNKEGTLLFQTQAMPGYTNKVKYVFDTPGTYRVICMELCGTGHHDMIDEFQVLAEVSASVGG